jgi:phage/plasmid-like protein (TIGR03299 family)
MAKTGEVASVGSRDVIKGYVLLSTSCDGSMATEGRRTSVRVVCDNTLGFARAEGRAAHRTTHRSVFLPDVAKGDLGLKKDQFADFMDDMRRLADTKLLDSEVVAMTVELFKPGSAKLATEEFKKALDARAAQAVLSLVLDGKARGSTLDGVKGTAYGWLNGVTEYVDHAARARSDENRFASAFFGPGDTLKTRAFEMALAA